MKVPGILLAAAAFAAPAQAAQRDPYPPEFIAAMQAERYADAARIIKVASEACQVRAQTDECYTLLMAQGQVLSMLPPQQNAAATVAAFRKSLDLADRFSGPESPDALRSGHMLTLYLVTQGMVADAATLLERLVPAARRRTGAGSILMRQLMTAQAFSLMMLQRVPESSKVIDTLVADLRAKGDADGVLEVLLDRADFYFGDKAKAESLRREMIATPEFAQSTNAALKIKVLSKLAQALFENGNMVEAVDVNQRLLALAASAKVETAEVVRAREVASRYAQGGAVDRMAEQRGQCASAKTKFGARYMGAVYLCMALGYELATDRRTEAEGLALIRENYAIAKADYSTETVFGMSSLIMGLVNLSDDKIDAALRNYDDGSRVLAGYYAKSQPDQMMFKAIYARQMMARPDLLPRARMIAREVVEGAVLSAQTQAAFDEKAQAQLRSSSPLIRMAVMINWRLYAVSQQRAR